MNIQWGNPYLELMISAFFLGLLLMSILIISKNLYITSLFHFFFNLPFKLNSLTESNDTLIVHNKETFFSVIVSILLFHLIFSPLYLLAIYMYKKAINLVYTTKVERLY